MSVVNQMLMDLERRGALQEDDAPGPEVHAVQPSPPAALRLSLVALLLVAVAAAAWAAARTWHPLADAPPVVVTQGEVRAIQPVPPPFAAREDAGSGEGTSLRPPALMEPVGVGNPPPAPLPAREPERTPAQAAPPAQKPAAKPVPERAPARVAAATAIAPRASSERSEAPPVAPSIDKTPRQLSPQQQAESEFARGASLVSRGRVEEAIEALRGALSLDPAHVRARQMLAALLVESRRSGEAEQVLMEGLRASPDDPRLAMVLGRLEAERADFQAALATLQGAAGAAVGDAAYQGFMGTVLQRLGRHQEAVERYLAAVRLSPQSGVWWMGLGISLQAEGRLGDAREAYQRAKATNTLGPDLVAFLEERLARLPAGR